MSDPDRPREVSWRGRDVFVLVPSLVAVFLGLLYAAGAIIKGGQLRGAHLSILDTLPLVPLEQLLALGIGTLVTSPSWIATFGFLVLLYLGTIKFNRSPVHLPRTKPRTDSGPASARTRRERAESLVLFAVFVFVLGSVPVSGALLVLAAGSLFPLILLYRGRIRSRRDVAALISTYIAIVVGAQLVSAYYWPKPLPAVRLTMESGRQQHGTLIAATGDTWYLSARKGSFQAVPAALVVSADIRTRKRPKERAAFLVVWDKVTGLF